jgi:hypothetical protein
MMSKRKVRRVVVATAIVMVVGIVVVGGVKFVEQMNAPLVVVYHCPDVFERRWGDFTANVTGRVGPAARGVRYRVNDGRWIDLSNNRSRVPAPKFTVEIPPADLIVGHNTLEFTGKRFGIWEESAECEFDYDPSPIELPVVEDWSHPDLDAQDGYWETIQVDGEWRVRPVPGQEDYDRIVVVTGAFPQGRRVETTVTLRDHDWERPFGFGVLPLWGGRPDVDGVLPRRGWNFSLVWFYSHYEGVGQEFSYKETGALPEWVSNYRSIDMETNVRYHIVIEAWPVNDEEGAHLYYRQRMKWWAEGQQEPEHWMDFTDIQGSPLPEGEFCVALVAHRSQVEYGAVRVLPIHHQK